MQATPSSEFLGAHYIPQQAVLCQTDNSSPQKHLFAPQASSQQVFWHVKLKKKFFLMKFTLNKHDRGEISISQEEKQKQFRISALHVISISLLFQHGGPVVVSMAIPQATLSLSASSGLYAKVSFILL